MSGSALPENKIKKTATFQLGDYFLNSWIWSYLKIEMFDSHSKTIFTTHVWKIDGKPNIMWFQESYNHQIWAIDSL